MRLITLKSKYIKLIREGRKVQTIRKNSDYYSGIKPGDIGYLTNYREKIKIEVTHAYVKKREELTEEEAILDGFFGLIELLPLVVYPEIKVIRFKLVLN